MTFGNSINEKKNSGKNIELNDRQKKSNRILMREKEKDESKKIPVYIHPEPFCNLIFVIVKLNFFFVSR